MLLAKQVYLTNLESESNEYLTLVGAAYQRGKLCPVFKKDHKPLYVLVVEGQQPRMTTQSDFTSKFVSCGPQQLLMAVHNTDTPRMHQHLAIGFFLISQCSVHGQPFSSEIEDFGVNFKDEMDVESIEE